MFSICLLHAAMHDMRNESTKPCTETKIQELHDAQETTISRIPKGIYRGPTNLRPRNVRNASKSYAIKPSSLFMAALWASCFGLLMTQYP